ncbi:MAG: hypothetical protein ACFFDX_16345 [Candidatus Odinarchaeota archaeon]
MSNKLEKMKDLEPVKEDDTCFCRCLNSNDSGYSLHRKSETTQNKSCCE